MKRYLTIACAALLLACHGRKHENLPAPTLIFPMLATSTDTLSVKANTEFWLEHLIENGDSVYAVAARLSYDTAFVQVVKTLDNMVHSESGGYLGTTGHFTAFLVNGVQGILGMAYSKQGPQPGQSGSGLLWRIRMRARRVGFTELVFDKLKSAVLSPNFIAGEQERLPAEFVDAKIEVETFNPMRVRLRIVN